jgi:hypothetical protein
VGTVDWLRDVTDAGPVELRDDTRFRPHPSRPVSVQVMGPNSIDVLTARDIALKGVGIYLPHGFEGWRTQPDVELVITLPGQRPFLTKGKVRHRTSAFGDESFFGVEFVDLAKQRREQIRRYLDSGIASRIN